MVPRGSKVFIDACAIAGAVHTGCFKAITGAYQLETTELCLGEVVRRNYYGARLVYKDPEELRKYLSVRSVSEEEIGMMDILIQGTTDIDPGEKSLLALALKTAGQAWLLCGPDAGTLRAMHFINKTHQLCSMDQMCALETLTKGIGLRKKFEGATFNLSEEWLKTKRMMILSV